MPRPAKPVQLLLMEGNTRHLTKEEIEYREDNEIKIGDTGSFKMPSSLKRNREAIKKWLEVVSIYQGLDFVTDADTGAIERYCLLYSDWLDLQKSRSRIFRENRKMKVSDEITLEKISDLQIDEKISKKLDQILKLEDRLFLNPLSKVRSLPKGKKEKTEPSELDKMGFGG